MTKNKMSEKAAITLAGLVVLILFAIFCALCIGVVVWLILFFLRLFGVAI